MLDINTAQGHATVLIVEDQALIRAALRGFMQIAFPSCSLLEAVDGEGALDVCAAGARAYLVKDCPTAELIPAVTAAIGIIAATRTGISS